MTDKAKTLITLNSALLAILTIFFPKITGFNSWWATLLFLLGIICLINAIIITWAYFDVQKSMNILLDQGTVDLDTDDLKKSIINSYRQCYMDTNNRTNFLVSLYMTSRFFFLSGFLIILIAFLGSYFFKLASNDTEKIIRELRSDPKLIELLRGPKGDTGERGPQGEKGEKGENSKPASKQQ